MREKFLKLWMLVKYYPANFEKSAVGVKFISKTVLVHNVRSSNGNKSI